MGLLLSHGVRKHDPLLLFFQWMSNIVLLPKVPKNVLGYEDYTKKSKISNLNLLSQP